MAGVKDNALIKLRGFPQGLDNLSAETELPMGKAGAGGVVQGSLRVAENVDIDEAGKVSRRDGYAVIEALPGLHSLWASKRFPYMLAVYDGNLVSFDETLTRATVIALTAPKAAMSFDYDAGWAYYTNGFDCGRVSLEGAAQPWAVEQPIGQPLITAHGVGGLYAGTYQVAVTYLDDDGRESGSTLAAEVDLTTGQGILLSSIPQPVDAGVTTVRVYCTMANGEELRWVADLPVGVTTYVVGVHEPGKVLDTQFQEALPAGQIVRLYRGRMYVFRDRVLYWSEAQHYGQGVLHSNYLAFNEPGTLIEGVHAGDSAGLYVAAGKRTYFMTGSEPKQWQRAIAHPYGAVRGSSVQADAHVLGLEAAGELPYWLDSAGQFVIGTPGGRVQPLHAERYVAPTGVESAATVLREAGGLRHFITTFQGGQTSGLAVSDVAEAEVWKDGVRLS